MSVRGRFIPLALLGLAGLAVIAGGCASASSTRDLGHAIDAYRDGRFSTGHQYAAAAMDRLKGSHRDRAVYLTGLCAYRLDNLHEAESRFRTAAESSDALTAARSEAMLGLVRMDQGEYREAAERLETAAQGLTGDDRRRAEEQATSAWQMAGVERPVAEARHGPSDPGRTGYLAGATSGFALQAGAFREHRRARAAAGRLETVARRYALGPVRVIHSREEPSGEMYFVRVGRFPSRQDAARVRSDLGRSHHFIVVPY